MSIGRRERMTRFRPANTAAAKSTSSTAVATMSGKACARMKSGTRRRFSRIMLIELDDSRVS